MNSARASSPATYLCVFGVLKHRDPNTEVALSVRALASIRAVSGSWGIIESQCVLPEHRRR